MDSNSGSISVSKFIKVGTYQIKIVGILPDKTTKMSSIFTIEIKRNLKEKLNSKIEIMASTTTSYSLSFIDGTPDEYVTHQLLPYFVKFNFPVYQLMPSKKSDVGSHLIQGQLYQTEKIISFQIILSVINLAPYYLSGKIPN